MLILKILGFLFLIPGALTVIGAKPIVRKYGMDRNIKTQYESEMNEQELSEYKFNRAVINVKMLGLLIALPGFVFIMIAFR